MGDATRSVKTFKRGQNAATAEATADKLAGLAPRDVNAITGP